MIRTMILKISNDNQDDDIDDNNENVIMARTIILNASQYILHWALYYTSGV